ncbi:MAG: tetratricopeptide repeat protein, partial [Candidatus Krumholzibacteriota bacterium]|nr:tetratricopeptide repeat protein [Candidatus Krumholzibacteriota bacterium]
MDQQRNKRIIAAAVLTIACAWLMISVSLQAARAPEVSDLGVKLEEAKLYPYLKRVEAIKDLQGDLQAILEDDLPRRSRGPLLFLAAEMLYRQGAYTEAAVGFQTAQKALAQGSFADDAAFASILAREGAGFDEESSSAWIRWNKHYGQGPLASEGLLSEVWNAIRRGSLEEARDKLSRLNEKYPWMKSSGRANLARAVLYYGDGLYDQALSVIRKAGDGAASLFLQALCLRRQGNMFRALERFQEVINRYPESYLRGYALLAKGNIFLDPQDFRDAAAEFALLSRRSPRADISSEAALLEAACVYLCGEEEAGINLARQVAQAHRGTAMAARAWFMLGEMRWKQGRYEDAIVEFNQVLTGYYKDELAGKALYRTARCLDALGRYAEANSTYQAVASGYPYSPEAPAAIYLAGVGLLERGLWREAAPWFQLVLDRYPGDGSGETYSFKSMEHQELTEASLCLLEYSCHQAGDMGKLSGAPHLVLHKMPTSRSIWRAYALLMDADALAAQARYPQAQEVLDKLFREFPDHVIGIKANRLLAWTYARQGRQDLA